VRKWKGEDNIAWNRFYAADPKESTMRGSIAGWGMIGGKDTSVYRPAATSTNTTFAVSSVRVVLMCSLRTALIATVARRNRFTILMPAE
jgi:hypothetical protein